MKSSTRSRFGRLSGLVVSLLALNFTVGCGEDFNELETPATCTQELNICDAHVFLQVDEFEFLRQNGAVVLDSRSADDFANGHIPGSVNASWRAFVNPDLNGIVWDDEALLQDAARALGINNDDTIVVVGVGDGSGGDSAAGRLYWTLQYLGHDDIFLVDGGFAAWTEARYDGLQAGTNEPTPSEYVIDIRPDRRATIDDVKDAIDTGDLRLVDTRRIDEWIGEELRNNPEGGHIPEAVHYHWEDVFDENGRLRPADDIRADLEELGITPGTLTIPYCQSGVRSGFFYAVLQWLDYPEPKNYDGSWWEWSRADDVEIIRPEEEA